MSNALGIVGIKESYVKLITLVREDKTDPKDIISEINCIAMKCNEFSELNEYNDKLMVLAAAGDVALLDVIEEALQIAEDIYRSVPAY